MNPDVAHGQMLPVEENPFHLEPVLRRYMYPFQVWQTLVDKDILRTFIVPPYVKDEVSLLHRESCRAHCTGALLLFWCVPGNAAPEDGMKLSGTVPGHVETGLWTSGTPPLCTSKVKEGPVNSLKTTKSVLVPPVRAGGTIQKSHGLMMCRT
jgi:hypothetical protein